MVVKLLIRWVIAAAALLVAAMIVPGIRIEGTSAWVAVLVMAVILGFANAIIRPVLTLLSCGCIVLTLGLFIFVVNAVTLWIASWITVNWFGVGFYVDGLWPALLGALIVSIVSFLLSVLIPGDR